MTDEEKARASSECPVCGVDTPHAHNEFEIVNWVNDRIRAWGFTVVTTPYVAASIQEQKARIWQEGYDAGWEGACHQYKHAGSDRREENPYLEKPSRAGT